MKCFTLCGSTITTVLRHNVLSLTIHGSVNTRAAVIPVFVATYDVDVTSALVISCSTVNREPFMLKPHACGGEVWPWFPGAKLTQAVCSDCHHSDSLCSLTWSGGTYLRDMTDPPQHIHCTCYKYCTWCWWKQAWHFTHSTNDLIVSPLHQGISDYCNAWWESGSSSLTHKRRKCTQNKISVSVFTEPTDLLWQHSYSKFHNKLK